MPRLRYHPPARLPGAANFTLDAGLRGSLNAVKLVKSQKWVWKSLREACELEKNYGRHRAPGHWELVTIAFVASRQIDVQPWWDETTDELWSECGFENRPSCHTTWRRMREIETVCAEFLNAAALVIQRCKMHDSRVMAHVHFDSTEDETHAALVHDCRKGEKCSYKEPVGRTWGQSRRPGRVSTAAAREQRHELAALDEETSLKREKATSPEKVQFVKRKGRTIKRIHMRGCWFRTRDLDGGIRKYEGPRKSSRFWHGYYSGKAICHFTGGVIPSVDNASIQESKLFPDLFDRTSEMVGKAPETAIGDRGLSISACFEHVTRAGAAPIFPWRAYNGEKGSRERDFSTHDRHGSKRCKFCGGPMKQVRFAENGGNPRLWFNCILQTTEDCEKDQTIACSTDWRLLVALPQADPWYQELEQSHQTYEAVHLYWRNRYRVAADELANRPKVVSLDWHRLRANAACLIDWLRIASLNGWLGSKKKKIKPPRVERLFKKRGEEAAERLADLRTFLELGAPYGAAAELLGVGEATMPSERPPPKLAGA
jgi:hypothetical protein